MENIEGKADKAKVAPKSKYKISEDSARAQMDALMESYDIDANDIVVENGPEAMDTIINRLVRAIRTGKVEIHDDGSVSHTLMAPQGDLKVLAYQRLNGIAMKERDKAKGGNFHKDCAFMGSLCNYPAGKMAALDPIDISIFQRLAALFMVV